MPQQDNARIDPAPQSLDPIEVREFLCVVLATVSELIDQCENPDMNDVWTSLKGLRDSAAELISRVEGDAD